jgi:glycosyltransferase involved in cell wall biosynthesis
MSNNYGYVKREDRKKILLLSDDIRLTSGISTVAREMVIGTARKYNWVNLGAAIQHPDIGKRLDVSQDTNSILGIPDASVYIYPSNGYGDPDTLRQLIDIEKPDALVFFTDPRYWIFLFQMENEIRKKLPMIYLNIWDDLPAPLYNRPYYESCDTLMAISKQTFNINKMVLGEKAKDKIIRYVPHGINEKVFYPINEFMKEDNEVMEKMRSTVMKGDKPEFVVFYNARNLRRKSTSDLIAAYAIFCDSIGKDAAKNCALVLHTQAVDENGTDLNVVSELFCNKEYQKVYITDSRISAKELNALYNLSDVTCLISSNEGWGLSLTESMMCGKMIIANVTGGMQDQMRFEDENGNWIEFNEDFPSNHFGTYKKCGEWAVPVFPSNSSVVGSIPTPYIFDDRCDFRDVAKAVEKVYRMPKEERDHRGKLAREWVLSEESMMSAENMAKNVIDAIDDTLSSWKPRENFQFIKIDAEAKKNSLVHKLVY